LELVCVRHGRTAWNAVRRFQGRTDVPLDDEGRAQAQALAAHLASEHFDFALASDLSRATATAAAIGAACGVAVMSEPRLREMNFGAWEGLTWDEITERFPETAGRPSTAARQYTPVGGETFDDVSARIRDVLADVTARLTGDGRALIVSHAGVMHAILRVALDETEPAALGVSLVPASIMRLSGNGSLPWRLDIVNEVAPPLADSAAVPP
jgi:broad specificity phosphatase PhoE